MRNLLLAAKSIQSKNLNWIFDIFALTMLAPTNMKVINMKYHRNCETALFKVCIVVNVCSSGGKVRLECQVGI